MSAGVEPGGAPQPHGSASSGSGERMRRTSRMLSGRGALLVAILLSVLVSAVYWQRLGFTVQLLVPVCSAVALASVLLVVSSARSVEAPAGVGSLCISVIGLVGVALPAEQLVSGERVSVLAFLGVFSPNVIDDAPRAGLVFLLCLCAFSLTELLPLRMPTDDPIPAPKPWESPRLYWALLVVGFITTAAFSSTVSTESLADRNQSSGQGILQVLQQCFLVAIALGVGNRHWGSRRLAVVSGFALAFSLAYSGSRSGLLFVVVALGVRWLHQIRRRGLGLGAVLGFSALSYGAAVFIVGFAQWRAAFRQQGSADLAAYLLAASGNPFGELSSQGSLDTFDGLILSLNVDPKVVGATILDPLRAVLNLVPTQLWAAKPGYLAPEVTHYYTLFGGKAGIFLSGPGYAYIITGGLLGACVFFAVLGLAFRLLSARYWHSPVIMTILLYTLFRFIIGGDSFDFQYGITLVLSIAAGRIVVFFVSVVRSAIRHEPVFPYESRSGVRSGGAGAIAGTSLPTGASSLQAGTDPPAPRDGGA